MNFDELMRFQPSERETVVISRHWDNPKITVTVNQDKIAILMQMSDFVDALVAEIGDPRFLLPEEKRKVLSWRERLKQRFDPPALNQENLGIRVRHAAHMAVEKIKEASAQAIQ